MCDGDIRYPRIGGGEKVSIWKQPSLSQLIRHSSSQTSEGMCAGSVQFELVDSSSEALEGMCTDSVRLECVVLPLFVCGSHSRLQCVVTLRGFHNS